MGKREGGKRLPPKKTRDYKGKEEGLPRASRLIYINLPC